jgi:thiol-disulfide isomerase/thioredoxin
MKLKLFIIKLLLAQVCCAQAVSGIYKAGHLLSRLSNADTLFVVNFWATWCKPCVQELPAFDSLKVSAAGEKVKILLVCLDFREDIAKKVNPFLRQRHVQSECVLLDEVDGNSYINSMSPKWSGAIPATLFIKGKKRDFHEGKVTLKRLQAGVAGVK